MGSVFGTALFGSILTNRVGHYMQANFAEFAKTHPDVESLDPSTLSNIQSNTALIKTLDPEVQHVILDAFVKSFQVVFLVAGPVVFLGFIFSLLIREVPLRTSEDYAQAKADAAGEALG